MIQKDSAFDKDYKNKICPICKNTEDKIYFFSKAHKGCKTKIIQEALKTALHD